MILFFDGYNSIYEISKGIIKNKNRKLKLEHLKNFIEENMGYYSSRFNAEIHEKRYVEDLNHIIVLIKDMIDDEN